MQQTSRPFLFWTCFIALVATSFGFISRAFMLQDWGEAFGLTETQQGEIFGAGLWPFAISMLLFSLVVDRVGYRLALGFAFLFHIVSAVMTIMATGYQSLYWAAFIGALGNGTVEAVINPVIASAYRKEKTKWLNILHAGWPAGLMIAGMLTILLGASDMTIAGTPVNDWHFKVGLIFIPTIIYGVMLLRCQMPVSERVEAGVSYRQMLSEAGGLGIFIPTVLIVQELGRVLGGTSWAFSLDNQLFLILLGLSVAISVVYGVTVRSAIGRPMYVFMLIIMIALATTELGTDGWIKDLMSPAMELIGLDGGWILVYTALLMTVLRFLVGPIMRISRLQPLGLLALSCVLVIIGIVWLSNISTGAGLAILIAATIYGAGQCFFWPTTLGFVAERFPKGGALTLNAIAGVGMLGVGILGGPWLGYVQNTTIEDRLKANHPALYEQVMGEPRQSMFGSYRAIDEAKLGTVVDNGSAEQQEQIGEQIEQSRSQGKSQALFKVAVLPLFMLICYLGLIVYFRSKGGYRPINLVDEPDDEREIESVDISI